MKKAIALPVRSFYARRFRLSFLATFSLLAVMVLAKPNAAAQVFSDLYNLGSSAGDPTSPGYPSLLAQGRDGNLYGTTQNGGVSDLGAAFKITPDGVMTALYSFDDLHGKFPTGGLVLGTDGNLYGTASKGGTLGFGTIFKLTPSGTLTVLYNFTGGNDGANPQAAPVLAADGNFYGTTFYGGTFDGGVAYKITGSGNYTTLHSFSYVIDGDNLTAPLVQGNDGNFYGTASAGGNGGGGGDVFRLSPSGAVKVLYTFDGTHGVTPFAGLVQASDNNFYGVAVAGGTFSNGVLYKVTPNGSFTVLHNMDGSQGDGSAPIGGLLQGTDGNLYGSCSIGGNTPDGTLFKATTKGAFSVPYVLDHVSGSLPYSTLTQHTNGPFYGETHRGGSFDLGTVYNLDMGLAPFIAFVVNSGKVGKQVQILGGGFTGTTSVTFNGSPAIFKVVADTYLTANVPAGATTGNVQVVTPTSTLTSNKVFRVTPSILNFTPGSGQVGTSVTINGTSFAGTAKIAFGGVSAASFTVNNDSMVTVSVPTGAKSGKITLTTPGGTATSATSFTVLP
jgi:uncharacterized repeat protein (TIGR03803 family)